MIFKPFLFLTILLVFFSNSYAYDVSLGLGNLSEHIGRIQTDEAGTKNGITFNPYIKAAVDFTIIPELILSPEIGTCLPKSSPDANNQYWHFYTMANAKYNIQSFQIIAGTGLFFNRIWGDGGEASLSNGLGTTSFPLADHSSVSYNWIVNIGAAYNFYTHYFVELHGYVFNLTTAEDRSFSLGLNVNYHFGELF